MATNRGPGALLLVAACTLVASGAACAAGSEHDVYAGWLQPGPPPIERFVKPLGLTADQQKKLKPIFDDARAKAARDAKDAQSRSEPADGERVGGVLSQREADFRVQLASVLSAEQMTQYEALVAAQGPSPRTVDPRPAHGHRESNREAPPLESK